MFITTEEDRLKMGIQSLPGSLGEALIELENDPVIQDSIGPATYEAFRRAKLAERDEYRTAVTDWEVKRYLESA
jgi:glutamine synthetase